MAHGASGNSWAIATPHEAATTAGAGAFERGGNAVDAILAAATTLAVVYPHMCGVGGDLFALVEQPGAPGPVAICSSGAAPEGLSRLLRGKHSSMPERGPLTVTVPGAVAGWGAVHLHGAVLPWSQAFSSAIAHADAGVPVAQSLAAEISESRDLALAHPAFAEGFFPGGEPLRAGASLQQPALARTLESIAAHGPAAFYSGPVGAMLVEALSAEGSPISVEDLAAHNVDVGPPVIGRWRDLDVVTTPPTSQGFVLLEILRCLDRLGIDTDPMGPAAGTLALIFAAAALDRDRHLADPRAMRMKVETLMDDGHIAALCDQVRDSARPAGHRSLIDGDTVGLVAADSQGHAVSLIQSLSWGFGSGILDPATGVIAQNRGTGFSLDPEHPAYVTDGLRPAHTLMPVMAYRDGRPAAISGTMGGSAHPQINAMSLIRSMELGMDPAATVAAPRWLVGGMDPETSSEERFVIVEESVSEAARTSLSRAGFRLDGLPDLDEGLGHAHLITLGADGTLASGTDPRADGSALAS